MKNFLILFVAMASLASMTAVAQNYSPDRPQFYIGGSYGYFKVKDADEFDDDNDAVQGIIGLQLNEYFAIEGGYIDFGEYGNSDANADVDGATLGLKAGVPVFDFMSIYLKGGMLWWDSDYEILGVGGDNDGEEPFYGVGVSFGLSDHIDLFVEYTRYAVDLEADEVGGILDDISDEHDIDHASVGVLLKF